MAAHSARSWRARDKPARDLAAEAQEHSIVRETFVKHAMTRLPLIGVFVITINLFVQVRGDVGLAVAVAQNLTFGSVAVIVMLNLVLYLILAVMVAAMPLVFDSDYNTWTRIVGSALLVLLAVVLAYTGPWVLLLALVVVFVIIGIIVLSARRKATASLTRDTIQDELEVAAPPVDVGLRALWIEGRAVLRVISPTPLPVHAAEYGAPTAQPRTLGAIADEWNSRAAEIREPRAKTVPRLAFAATIGFVALFGLSIITTPIRFAPLELVSIDDAPAREGFVLLSGTRGVFVPNPFGTTLFISADDVTSRQLCEVRPEWWSVSLVDVMAPIDLSGVVCTRQ